MAQTVKKDVHFSRYPALRLVAERRIAPVRFESVDVESASNLRLVSELMLAAGSRLPQAFTDVGQPVERIAPAGRSGITCRARLILDSGASTGCAAARSGLVALYTSDGLTGLLPASLPKLQVVTAALGSESDAAAWHEAALLAWSGRRGNPRVGVIGEAWAPVERARALATLWPDADFQPLALAEAAALFATDASAFDIVLATAPAAEVFARMGAALSGTQHCAARVVFAGPEEHFEDISIPTGDDASQSDPSGLVLAAVWLLRRAGETSAAERLHNAWLKTLEDGLHTPGLKLLNPYTRSVSAAEFADALGERLGHEPRHRPAVRYADTHATQRGQLRICR